jgi:hypothetical protein
MAWFKELWDELPAYLGGQAYKAAAKRCTRQEEEVW